MDRLGWARTLAFAGLALSLAGLPLGYLWLGDPRTLITGSLVRVAQAVALFLPGLALSIAGYTTYSNLPVALRSRTRAPFLILLLTVLLPLVGLTAILTARYLPA